MCSFDIFTYFLCFCVCIFFVRDFFHLEIFHVGFLFGYVWLTVARVARLDMSLWDMYDMHVLLARLNHVGSIDINLSTSRGCDCLFALPTSLVL